MLIRKQQQGTLKTLLQRKQLSLTATHTLMRSIYSLDRIISIITPIIPTITYIMVNVHEAKSGFRITN